MLSTINIDIYGFAYSKLNFRKNNKARDLYYTHSQAFLHRITTQSYLLDTSYTSDQYLRSNKDLIFKTRNHLLITLFVSWCIGKEKLTGLIWLIKIRFWQYVLLKIDENEL